MRTLITIAAITSLVFVSCKKDRSAEVDTGGGSIPSGPLLTKAVVEYSPTDFGETDFVYDANKRVINVSTNDPLQNSNFETSITRNSQGIIQTISSFDGVDSYNYKVNYNSSSKQYTSQVTSVGGEKDSIVYKYSSGRIIEAINYYDDGLSGGYFEYAKTTYTYGGNGNISKMQIYQYDDASGRWDEYGSVLNEFDSKVNALNLGVEGVLLNEINYTGSNNITKSTIINAADPTQNLMLVYTYQYNSKNQPEQGELSIPSVPGAKAPLKFYYK